MAKSVKTPPRHTVHFDFSTPPTADHAAAIYGMTAKALVRAILENKDGKYDRLYTGKPPVNNTAD